LTEIICISAAGKARPDKEIVAQMLKGELKKAKKRVLITRFADPIKHICRNWYNWNGRMDDIGRSLMQYVGTDIVRAQRPDFWVDFTMGLLSLMGDEWDYVIIPDCRWPNEMDLGRYGFQARHLRIEDKRGGAATTGGSAPPGNPAPDFTLVSDASPDQLRSDVAAIAETLLYA